MGRYREQAPSAALSPWVECAWSIEPGERIEQHRVLPDGCIDVLWSERFGVTVVGPMTRAFVAPLEATSRVAGIRFHPGAAPALLGIRAEALLDGRVPTAELFGDEGKQLEEDAAAALDRPGRSRPGGWLPPGPLASLGRFVAARAAHSPWPDPLVREAARRLGAGEPLDDLGVSERHLRRRVTAEVGYGPKRLARVLRLRRALAAARDDSLASVAYRAGYADQAHFTNDCVALAGISPGRFLQDAAA